jgi:hypothetical protein
MSRKYLSGVAFGRVKVSCFPISVSRASATISAQSIPGFRPFKSRRFLENILAKPECYCNMILAPTHALPPFAL